MKTTILSPENIVADVLRESPATIHLFNKYHLGCVGCGFSIYDTLSEVAAIYDIPIERFLDELLTNILKSQEENK